MNERVVSTHFPYVAFRLQIGQQAEEIEAYIDSGFDGDILVPAGPLTAGEVPDGEYQWTLADG